MTDLCRRTLLKGAAVTCGTGLLAACGDSGTTAAAPQPAAPAPSGAAPGVRFSLGPLSDVPVGGAISVSVPGEGTVLVAQPTEGEVVAFSAVCPHEGCSAAPDTGGFTCPCHGSQFALDGSVTRGPAQDDLAPFAVQVVDGQVLPA